MPLKLLLVCTANVCRSPAAAALLSYHCQQRGLDVAVGSAGTDAGGLPVDPVVVEILAERGLDIPQCRSRRLVRSIVDDEGADMVLTMTRHHLRIVATTADGAFLRTFTLREFVRRAAHREPEADENLDDYLTSIASNRRARDLMGDDLADDISDPYGASLDVYQIRIAELDRLTEDVARVVASLAHRGQ